MHRSVESADGSLNHFTFSVVRTVEYEYVCYTHLLNTDAWIERDSCDVSDPIPKRMAHKFLAWSLASF